MKGTYVLHYLLFEQIFRVHIQTGYTYSNQSLNCIIGNYCIIGSCIIFWLNSKYQCKSSWRHVSSVICIILYHQASFQRLISISMYHRCIRLHQNVSRVKVHKGMASIHHLNIKYHWFHGSFVKEKYKRKHIIPSVSLYHALVSRRRQQCLFSYVRYTTRQQSDTLQNVSVSDRCIIICNEGSGYRYVSFKCINVSYLIMLYIKLQLLTHTVS